MDAVEQIVAAWDKYLESHSHCDDYIDDPNQPECLRRFLRYHRWPALYQCRAQQWGIERPKLFATYQGQRVRVVMASRIGDVGITTRLNADHGYNKRVMVDELSDFSEQE